MSFPWSALLVVVGLVGAVCAAEAVTYGLVSVRMVLVVAAVVFAAFVAFVCVAALIVDRDAPEHRHRYGEPEDGE